MAGDDRGHFNPADDVVVFRQLFDLMPQLGWTAQPDGWIDYYNKGWYDYTGSTYEDMKGWGWTSVHDPKWLPVCMEAWTEAIKTGKPCQVEFPLRRHDGVFRWFLTRMNPLFNEQGQIVRWVGINTDIQDQKDKESEEKQRAQALVELDRAKTVFFNNISHEFRTPLMLMLGPIQTLLNESVGEQRVELETLRRNALRLLKLVNALLDFSRIEAGRYDAKFVPTDLCAFTTEICSLFRSAIEHEGLTFDVACEDCSESAFIDRDMWEKVVLNLVSNAFKFTQKGKISVRVLQTKDKFQLIVADTGSGIATSEQGNLFKRFHRLKAQNARTFEGTGIGLALVQELVQLHGGQISVTSDEGVGTEFTVEIPRGRAHLPPDEVTEEENAAELKHSQSFLEEMKTWFSEYSNNLNINQYDGLKQHIMIVEDNADVRAYLLRLLNLLWSAEAVPNGRAALEALKDRVPDLIVTDIMMPDIDGFELLRNIRASESLKKVPVIFLSARAGDEARAEGIEAGANDYLVKPFTVRELYARVAVQLQQRLLSQTLEKAVQERTQELQKALAVKTQFLSTVSHELRTPMAAVIGLVELMNAMAEDEEFKSYSQTALEACKRLLQILNDLLDASRLEANAFVIEKRSFSIQSVIGDLIQLADAEAKKKNLKLSWSVAENVPPLVCGDELRVRQIFQNLVFNALKFTEDGEIKLSITLEKEDNNCSDLRFEVTDSGIGIALDQQEKIFEPFSQADASTRRVYGGTGLGLSICRTLTKLMGGEIGVVSALGEGATFWVVLPFETELCKVV